MAAWGAGGWRYGGQQDWIEAKPNGTAHDDDESEFEDENDLDKDPDEKDEDQADDEDGTRERWIQPQ